MQRQFDRNRISGSSRPLDEAFDALLSLDFRDSTFEAAYSQAMDLLMAARVVRAHALVARPRAGEEKLLIGFWPAASTTMRVENHLLAREDSPGATGVPGSVQGEIVWLAQKGAHYREACRRLIPMVTQLLSLKWKSRGTAPGAPAPAPRDYARMLLLTEILRELDPTLPAGQQSEGVLRKLSALVRFDFAALAVLEERTLVVRGLTRGRFQRETLDAFLQGSLTDAIHRGCYDQTDVLPLPPLDPDVAGQLDPFSQRISLPLINRNGEVRGRLLLLRAADEAFLAEERASLVKLTEQIGATLENRATFLDLERQAKTDGMTGLFNYRTFRNVLAREFSRATRYKKPLSLIILDVDHFKQVNDQFGHPRGDEVLKGVAGALLATKRREDVAARYGGEEFVLVLPETSPDGALRVAERLRNSVAEAPLLAERPVTISLGVATYQGEKRQTEEGLIALADQALVLAKRSGRNRVEFGQGSNLRLVAAGA